MPVATLHNLVSGRGGLAGHGALLIFDEAALLVHEGSGAGGQRGEALLAQAAVPCGTSTALTHTLMLLFGQTLHLLL